MIASCCCNDYDPEHGAKYMNNNRVVFLSEAVVYIYFLFSYNSVIPYPVPCFLLAGSNSQEIAISSLPLINAFVLAISLAVGSGNVQHWMSKNSVLPDTRGSKKKTQPDGYNHREDCGSLGCTDERHIRGWNTVGGKDLIFHLKAMIGGIMVLDYYRDCIDCCLVWLCHGAHLEFT